MRVHLRRHNKKEKFVFTCDMCGKENVYDKEHFLRAFVFGREVHCKYCEYPYKVDDMYMDEDVERRVKNYIKKKGAT